MPRLDAYIPEGALSPSAERELLAKLTELLIEHEGVDPSTVATNASTRRRPRLGRPNTCEPLRVGTPRES